MKTIYLFIGIILLLGITTGCDKESEGWQTSNITYYVSFVFDLAEGTDQFGNQKIVIDKGDVYDVNSNYSATEGDTDVKDKTTIEGTVDGNTPGYYRVDYSAVNNDGYSAAATIGVFVADPAITTDISGSYSGDVYRTPTGSSFTGFPVTIAKVANGIFYIDRLCGSYYFDGLGYSAYGNYFVHGFVRLNADNTLTYLASYSPGWGDTLGGDGLEYGEYDPITGVVSFGSIYASGRVFHVTLTPN